MMIALGEELEKVKPMLEGISDRHKAYTTVRNWLTDLGNALFRLGRFYRLA